MSSKPSFLIAAIHSLTQQPAPFQHLSRFTWVKNLILAFSSAVQQWNYGIIRRMNEQLNVTGSHRTLSETSQYRIQQDRGSCRIHLGLQTQVTSWMPINRPAFLPRSEMSYQLSVRNDEAGSPFLFIRFGSAILSHPKRTAAREATLSEETRILSPSI